jgi:flavin-dependent dehydrogenase
MRKDSTDIYTVAIVGLGPAGATVARLLAQLRPDWRIVALDRKGSLTASTGDANTHTGWHKPCGGLLAPDAQKALARFGLSLPKSVLADPQIFAVRTLDFATNLHRDYRRFYINLDRAKFDDWLISLIPDSVCLKHETVVTDITEEQSSNPQEKMSASLYTLRYKQQDTEYTCCSHIVIGAEGARSLVRHSCLPHRQPYQFTAIQVWYVDANPQPLYLSLFDPAISPTYSWGLSKDTHFILGGAFVSSRAKECFALLKTKSEAQGFLLGEPLRRESCLVDWPQHGDDIATGSGSAFLVGEAAGFISTSSFEGLSYAFNSALALVDALQGDNPQQKYRRNTTVLRVALAGKRLKARVLFNAPVRHLIMRSGIKAL